MLQNKNPSIKVYFLSMVYIQHRSASVKTNLFYTVTQEPGLTEALPATMWLVA